MEEKRLSEKESLELISRMIQTTREKRKPIPLLGLFYGSFVGDTVHARLLYR